MMKHPAVSVFLGLFTSSIALFIVYVLFVLFTFSLSGGSAIERHQTEALILLCLAIFYTITSLILSKLFLDAKKKYMAISVSILPVLCMIVMLINYLKTVF